MRKITIILFGILFIFSCNNLNSNSKKTVINKEQNKDRNSTLLIFEDGVSLNIVSNFFSQKKMILSLQKLRKLKENTCIAVNPI
ncbi:MAG TPA: hypothetical protein DDZ39_00155 [Flavobacteriaceae bacterium]|nr:hypothetical protein [Flavobacteriaceae bacterium]